MKAKERGVLIGIVVVVALLIRVGYVATTHVKDPLRTDAGQYAQYAHNLAHHGVYSLDEGPPLQPDSFRSPGYPMFLAAAVAIGDEGREFAVARYVQVALGAAMALLTFLLARFALPFWGSLASAGLVALSPHMVTSTGYILTETLFGFVVLAGLLLFCRGVQRRSVLALASAGAVMGYAYLINESILLLPFALALLAWRSSTARPARVGCVWFVALFCAFAGSWSIRNAVSVEATSRTGSDRALITMSHGSYPGWVHVDPRYRYSAYLEDPEQPEFGTSWARFSTVWWRRFSSRPIRHLSWYLFEKPYYLWSWDILQGQGDIYVFPVAESLYVNAPIAEATRVTMKLLHPLILLLAAAGLLACLVRRGKNAGLVPVVVAVTVGYFTALYAVFAPWPRYSVPLRPELYLLAVWALVEVIALVRSRNTFRRARGLPPGPEAPRRKSPRPSESVAAPG